MLLESELRVPMKSLKNSLTKIKERAQKRVNNIQQNIDSKLDGLTAHGGWSVGYLEGRLEGLLTALDLIDELESTARNEGVNSGNIEHIYIMELIGLVCTHQLNTLCFGHSKSRITMS